MKIQELYSHFLNCNKVEIDTRKIKKNDILKK